MSARLLAPVGFAAFVAAALAQPAPAPLPAKVKAFASLNVAELWDHKALAPARESRGRLEFAWLVQSIIGVAPTDLDRLTLFWPDGGGDLPVVVLHTRKATSAAAVAKTLSRPGAAAETVRGKAVPVVGGEFAVVLPLDDKTLLLAPPGADPDAAAALVPTVRAAAGSHTLTIGANTAALPPEPALKDARSAVLTVSLGAESAAVRLTAQFSGDAAATAAEPRLTAKLRELSALAASEAKKAEARPPVGNAYPAPILEFLGQTLADAKLSRSGAAVTAAAEVKLEDAVGRVLTALPDAALAPRGASAAENNLKLIGLAMHSYHDVHNQFPANIYDKDGKALLSWRVQILPYLEQAQLFDRFKRDEAWDSPANKAVSQTVVRTYHVPGRPSKQPWETYFQTFTSPKTAGEHRALLEDGNPKGPGFLHITDGTSNTFLVVEAGDAVPWAKPDDLPYDGRLPLPKLGGPSGFFAVVMGDGSARTFRRAAFDDTNLRRAISIADGQVINFP